MVEIGLPIDIELFLIGCNPTCTEHIQCQIQLMERARCLAHFIRHRNATMIKALLDLEPINGKSKLVSVRCPISGTTALHEAIAAEDIALVRWLLRLGADIHQGSYQGITPLQLASRCLNKNIEHYLQHISEGMQLQNDVQNGILCKMSRAYINFRNPVTGDTALHLCIYSMHNLPAKDRERRIALLLELGADPHITNNALIRPIDCISQNRHNLPKHIAEACQQWLTSKVEQLVSEASERQLLNRGVLSLHPVNYLTTYNIKDVAFCQRALGSLGMQNAGRQR